MSIARIPIGFLIRSGKPAGTILKLSPATPIVQARSNRILTLAHPAILAWLVMELLAGPGAATLCGQAPDALSQKDLADLDISQLMDVQVTSVSKKEEPLSGAPAAIFVLRGEDMVRDGFATLPEALRLVPGLYVAETDSHTWQISARGFGDVNNNKMLVLVDGRTVYSPELGTVHWDALDIPLENIDRIEVIRGPGGTLWGANAVNGVINIVMKPAQQMQGSLASLSANPETGYSSTIRYGSRIGNFDYSLFGRASYWQPFQLPAGGRGPDRLTLPQGGLRMDWAPSGADTLTFEGAVFDGRFGAASLVGEIPASYLLKDSNLNLHWTHVLSDHSSTETLAYCDWYARFGSPGEKRNSCDLEFQHDYRFNPRHSLIWGASFLTTGDDLRPDPATYIPERRRTSVGSGFAQYEVAVVPDRLRILGGTKLEHNDYTGFEYQPQGRAAWTPNQRNTLWIGISRSVRIPSRADSDLDFTLPTGFSNGLPVFQNISGSRHLAAERIRAYEAGYRWQPAPALSFDLALYYNNYDALIFVQLPVTVVLPNEILMQQQYANGPRAQTHGVELGAQWRPADRWTLSGAVTEIRGSDIAVQATAQHLFNVQSRLALPHKMVWNMALCYSSALPLVIPGPGIPGEAVPAFARFDTGLLWHARPEWTFGLWGRNLQSSGHVETTDSVFGNFSEEIPRSVAFQLIWRSLPEDPKRK